MSVEIPVELFHFIFSALVSDPLWKAEQRYGEDTAELQDWIRDTLLSIATLRSLCLVSRTFRRIAQPLLYHTFRRRDYNEEGSFESANERTKLFLRTLLEGPNGSKLAAAVKEVSLGFWAIDPEGAPEVAPPSMELKALYQGGVPPSLDSSSGFRDQLDQGSADEEIVLLLSLCRNIEAMDFIPDNSAEEPVAHAICHFAESHWSKQTRLPLDQRILPKLRRLRIQSYSETSVVRFDDVKGLYSLPHLTHLYGTAVSLEVPWEPEDHDFQCNLRFADLRWSTWEVDGFSSFLRECPLLETLRISCGDWSVGSSEMKFERIGDILREHGTNLKALALDPRDSGDSSDLHLGDLRSLSSLQHLSVPLAQLVNYDEEGFDEDRTSTEAFSQLYKRLAGILPNSLLELILLDYYGQDTYRQSWPDGCLTYKEANGSGNFVMHICQRESQGYGNTGTSAKCTESCN